MEHVPQRDPGRLQRLYPLLIRHGRIGAEQLAHDAPEQVLWMRIVLACPKGSLAGHAAQDEDLGIRLFDGREALDVPHGLAAGNLTSKAAVRVLLPKARNRVSRSA